jgi:hypothetical protein
LSESDLRKYFTEEEINNLKQLNDGTLNGLTLENAYDFLGKNQNNGDEKFSFDLWIVEKMRQNEDNVTLLQLFQRLSSECMGKGWTVYNPKPDGFCTLYALYYDKNEFFVDNKNFYINILYEAIKKYFQTKTGEYQVLVQYNTGHTKSITRREIQNQQAVLEKLEPLKNLPSLSEIFLKIFPTYYNRNITSITFTGVSSKPVWIMNYPDNQNTELDTTILLNFSEHTFLLRNSNKTEKQNLITYLKREYSI